jgi:ADP-ribosylglycohydrolase
VHDRDLGADLEVIRVWGAEILVSLIEDHEYAKVGIADIGHMMPQQIMHLRLPIADAGIPDAAWEGRWKQQGGIIRSVLRRGGKVCLHCMGGLGRTGLVAARLLVEFGVHPEEAMRRVRAARPGTIENDSQEEYVRSLEPIWRGFDRARACMLAGACGDALGATVEFMRREEILARFGPGGIRDFVDNQYGEAGKITDDTQMSLFTAEGLIRAEVRGRLRGLSSYEGCVHHAYLRWLHTQGLTVPVEGFDPDGWLVAQPELHHQRAPGTTCLESLHAATGFGKPDKADNRSKGCGGVMRAAPAGLFAAFKHDSPESNRSLAFELGTKTARLTHGHPSGYLSAAALSLIIFDLISGLTLSDAIGDALAALKAHEGSRETSAKLEDAVRLAAGREDPIACIAELGQGWTGEEALAIAVFCALRAESLEEGICMAVNITGDSDSTGSIAGNLLGALHGCSAIPSRWLERLELKDTIAAVAEDLLVVHDSELSTWDVVPDMKKAPPPLEYELSNRESDWWMERYPGW